jgi:membrane protein implicated in regulation of membrane protease activity
MELWSEWWAWASAALILAILEVIVPGFFALGFAIGAAFLAVMVGLLGFGVSLGWSLVVFAVVSLIATLLLRHFFKLQKGQVKMWDTDIND